MSKEFTANDYLKSLDEELSQVERRRSELERLPDGELLSILTEMENLIARTRVVLLDDTVNNNMLGLIYEGYEERFLDLEARLQAVLKEVHG